MKTMATRALFPTLVYTVRLQHAGRAFKELVLRECRQLRLDDGAGRRWSAKHYPGGYTSYGSANRMHLASPTFAALEEELTRHVKRFAKSLAFDLSGRTLTMTDCWVNIVPRQGVHGLHLHPLSTLSGTYYVQTSTGCAGLKVEDPRLDRTMAAPPPLTTARADRGPWVVLPAEAGSFVLFESWLRHEVPANIARSERDSVSFNYSWF
jgi:uncharacterized protein (TIGR02466 family)